MELGVETKAAAKAAAETDRAAGGKERMQRVRIGLTGLGVVFLLVLIGAAVINWSEAPTNAATNQAIANAAPTEPNEPLAEIGAAPGESSAANAATANKQ